MFIAAAPKLRQVAPTKEKVSTTNSVSQKKLGKKSESRLQLSLSPSIILPYLSPSYLTITMRILISKIHFPSIPTHNYLNPTSTHHLKSLTLSFSHPPTTTPPFSGRIRSSRPPNMPSEAPPPQQQLQQLQAAVPPNFWGDMPAEEYYPSRGVRNKQSYFDTPNGRLFTQSFLPLEKSRPIKGTVFMTHGYGSDSGWCFQEICINYATWGYAVFAADLLGHGRSDGIRCYLGEMDKVAAASLHFFKSVRYNDDYKHLPAFLFGESMGGLVTMLMYLQSEPDTWTGIIFSAPLFVIPEPMKPSKVHLFMYGLLFGLADTWALMPDNRMVVKAIRDTEKLKIIAANPRRYTGKPRVGTMREISRQTEYVQNNFHKVTAPFLTVHGTADGVTCPSGSRMLYEKASSEDKSLKLYEGLYHSLIQGEPDEDAARVLADMRAWIDERAEKYGPKLNGTV